MDTLINPLQPQLRKRPMNPFFTSRRATVRRLLCTFILAGAASAPALAAANKPAHEASANIVIQWNTIAGEAFAPSQGTNPLAQSRTLAIMHAAIHDAVNAIAPRYQAYTSGLAPAKQASPDAAVASAAHAVLLALLPEQRGAVDAAYTASLKKVREGSAKARGIALGRAAAQATLARRDADGAATAAEPAYLPRQGAGEYQFTAPFEFAALPGWGKVHTFAIDQRQHATGGPLALDSAAYAADVAHIRALGQDSSRVRSDDQTEIAKFWYEDSPLGWNRIASMAVRKRKLDTWDAARAFALANFAMADGYIAGFHAKYQYRFWRPLTAIHGADGDGNPLTDADTSWKPLLVTPPVPDYPSTHTVVGWAAAQVLIELFGDRFGYASTSLTLPGTVRHYSAFSQAAEENGMSRLYAGIHFRHAVADGRKQGRSIGQATAKLLAPLR